MNCNGKRPSLNALSNHCEYNFLLTLLTEAILMDASSLVEFKNLWCNLITFWMFIELKHATVPHIRIIEYGLTLVSTCESCALVITYFTLKHCHVQDLTKRMLRRMRLVFFCFVIKCTKKFFSSFTANQHWRSATIGSHLRFDLLWPLKVKKLPKTHYLAITPVVQTINI